MSVHSNTARATEASDEALEPIGGKPRHKLQLDQQTCLGIFATAAGHSVWHGLSTAAALPLATCTSLFFRLAIQAD